MARFYGSPCTLHYRHSEHTSSLTYHCRALIIKPHVLLQLLVQFTFRSILQYEVHTCVVVEIAVHTQDVWMPDQEQHVTIMPIRQYYACIMLCTIITTTHAETSAYIPQMWLYLNFSAKLVFHGSFLQLRFKQHLWTRTINYTATWYKHSKQRL